VIPAEPEVGPSWGNLTPIPPEDLPYIPPIQKPWTMRWKENLTIGSRHT